MNVLILSGSNHGFAASAPVIHEFLSAHDDLSVALDDDKDVLASDGLRDFDVLIHGSGFTRGERQEDGTVQQVPELTPAQEEGVFDFVAGGKGLVGIHGTAWCIGGKAVDLLGGHANWHPPGSAFTVSIIDGDHPVTHGVPDFDVEDEIYMSAWDPAIRILATAEWSGKQHPLAWVKPYGAGRVFYTALGHGPGTFARLGMQQMMTHCKECGGPGEVYKNPPFAVRPLPHSGFPRSAPRGDEHPQISLFAMSTRKRSSSISLLRIRHMVCSMAPGPMRMASSPTR